MKKKDKKQDKKNQKFVESLTKQAKFQSNTTDLRKFTAREMIDPLFDWPAINTITVNSQFAKDQLLKASEYIHHLREIDTDYFMVNVLAHLYEKPELIIVQEKE